MFSRPGKYVKNVRCTDFFLTFRVGCKPNVDPSAMHTYKIFWTPELKRRRAELSIASAFTETFFPLFTELLVELFSLLWEFSLLVQFNASVGHGLYQEMGKKERAK